MHVQAKYQKFIKRITGLSKKAWIPHLLVMVFFAAMTAYYMSPVVANCTDTVYGYGDNTAGPIWRNMVSPGSPTWGYENVTNYPFGENLYNPVHFSGILQYTLYWILGSVAGPVCGYNLVNILGFISSAAVMYGFIYAVTRRRWIAILAGYAVTFTPYFQIKVGGHPSYGYQALLIGVLWSFYNLVKNRRKRDGIILAGLAASCFYFDPYFSLLSGILLLGLGLAWLIVRVIQVRQHKVKIEHFKREGRLLILSGLLFSLFVVPLFLILTAKSSEINSFVTSSRGNVRAEAKLCSNYPHEYAVPFVLHPVFEKIVGTDRYHHAVNSLRENFSCGIGEDSIGISITAIVITASTFLVLAWEKLNRRRLGLTKLLSHEPVLLLTGVASVLLLAVIFALPPVTLWKVPTVSYLLLELTTTWRTLSRIYLLVNMTTIILLALSLTYLAHNFRAYKKILRILFVIVFLAVFVEYQAFVPLRGNELSTFSYTTDAPAHYVWLRDNKNIATVAEYPIERQGGESDAMSYYLTMQSIHKKNLINGIMPNAKEESLRTAIKDISDPQTLPVLRALGADVVVLHGVTEAQVRQIPSLTIIYTGPQQKFNILPHTTTVKNDTVVIAKINQNVQSVEQVIQLAHGFPRNATIISSVLDWQYEAVHNSELTIRSIKNSEDQTRPMSVCFDIRMAGEQDEGGLLVAVDGGREQSMGDINNNYRRIKVTARETITLGNTKKFNMRIQNIGCMRNEL